MESSLPDKMSIEAIKHRGYGRTRRGNRSGCLIVAFHSADSEITPALIELEAVLATFTRWQHLVNTVTEQERPRVISTCADAEFDDGELMAECNMEVVVRVRAFGPVSTWSLSLVFTTRFPKNV